jgi:hypothetical protein
VASSGKNCPFIELSTTECFHSSVTKFTITNSCVTQFIGKFLYIINTVYSVGKNKNPAPPAYWLGEILRSFRVPILAPLFDNC